MRRKENKLVKRPHEERKFSFKDPRDKGIIIALIIVVLFTILLLILLIAFM